MLVLGDAVTSGPEKLDDADDAAAAAAAAAATAPGCVGAALGSMPRTGQDGWYEIRVTKDGQRLGETESTVRARLDSLTADKVDVEDAARLRAGQPHIEVGLARRATLLRQRGNHVVSSCAWRRHAQVDGARTMSPRVAV